MIDYDFSPPCRGSKQLSSLFAHLALSSTCPCCALWRGIVIGVLAGGTLGAFSFKWVISLILVIALIFIIDAFIPLDPEDYENDESGA